MTVNRDSGDEYLRRFRGVDPPRELRAKVLEKADGEVHAARSRSRDRWLVGVAALVLVLLTVVNAHMEERVRALTSGVQPGAVAPARGRGGRSELVEPFDSPFRARLALRRPSRVGEQSWLRLRAGMERIEG